MGVPKPAPDPATCAVAQTARPPASAAKPTMQANGRHRPRIGCNSSRTRGNVTHSSFASNAHPKQATASANRPRTQRYRQPKQSAVLSSVPRAKTYATASDCMGCTAKISAAQKAADSVRISFSAAYKSNTAVKCSSMLTA